MPISEDEYDRPNQSTMSKAEQRRNNKPIMEKRRRARINHCLNELKTLILDAMKKDPARHSKLEKADILEMTVKHLQTLQRQQLAVAVATDPAVLNKFKTGFNECAGEVGRYIGNMDGVETGVKQRLAAHLSNCVTGLQQVSPFSFPGITTSSNNVMIQNPDDLNNNQNRIQVPPGIQLIPSRLPTGELALLVPNSSNIPFFNSTLLGNNFVSESQQRSAFTNVKNTSKSPPLSPASSTTSFEDSFQRARSPKQVQVSFPTPPEQNQFRLHEQDSKRSQVNTTPISKEVQISFQTPPDQIHNAFRVYQHENQFQVTSSPQEVQTLFPTPPEQHALRLTQKEQKQTEQFQVASPRKVPTFFSTPPEQFRLHKPSDQQQTQQFQVTSTSYSPESKTNMGLKIEYKAVPIYQAPEKTNSTTNRHFSGDLEPLSVITNKEKYQNRPDRELGRKRMHGDEGLLTLAEPSTSKYARYSLDDVSTTSSSSSASPDHQFDSFYKQASSSGRSNCSSHRGDNENNEQNEHMWRPW